MTEIENIALILRQRVFKLQYENEILRKILYDLSEETKEQIDKSIAIAIDRDNNKPLRDGPEPDEEDYDERKEYFHKYIVCDWEG